jgi:hypothetical protein
MISMNDDAGLRIWQYITRIVYKYLSSGVVKYKHDKRVRERG